MGTRGRPLRDFTLWPRFGTSQLWEGEVVVNGREEMGCGCGLDRESGRS